MSRQLDPAFWQGKRVFVTGHTGFKGSWLTFWLHHMGAQVHGFALAPDQRPAMFDLLGLGDMVLHRVGDIRDAEALLAAMQDAAPDVVMHLAAQPIVSEGYRDPVGTFGTNVMGVVNLLEACRSVLGARVPVLVISSDKCYRNNDDGRAFRLDDPLGGHDPYSASKAGTEIVVGSYAASFFDNTDAAVLASARAGNVIGGGDWSANRLLADAARAFAAGGPLVLRNPLATRPWQHVVEPLYGYLVLIQAMAGDRVFAGPWNFGPADRNHQPVRQVAEIFTQAWADGARIEVSTAQQDWHEARTLDLDCSVTNARLDWWPVLDLGASVGWTAAWYKAAATGADRDALRDLTRAQIERYVDLQAHRS